MNQVKRQKARLRPDRIGGLDNPLGDFAQPGLVELRELLREIPSPGGTGRLLDQRALPARPHVFDFVLSSVAGSAQL
jgi:hypothetical protein